MRRCARSNPLISSVPKYFTGRARVFLQNLEANSDDYAQKLTAITKPIIARKSKFTNRAIRPELLTTLESSWRQELNHPSYRIGYHADIGKHKSAISEIRLVHLTLDARDRENGVGNTIENHAAICFVNLVVDRTGLNLKCIYRYVFSLHALARYLERCADNYEALRLDIISCLAVLPDEVRNNAIGNWKCVIMQLRGVADPVTAVGIRTWIEAE